MNQMIRWPSFIILEKNDTWIIDRGCSYHMNGDKYKFEHVEHYNGGSVRFKNDKTCYVKGKGCIALINKLRCDDSYCVKGLKHNPLSVAQLNNIGFKV